MSEQSQIGSHRILSKLPTLMKNYIDSWSWIQYDDCDRGVL